MLTHAVSCFGYLIVDCYKIFYHPDIICIISVFGTNKMNRNVEKFERIVSEYIAVAVSDELLQLLIKYRQSDPILETFDDRKLILYIVNKAIAENTKISTKKIRLTRLKNIKLKKTTLIKRHFDAINLQYKEFGVEVSSRQYFHRLILGYLEQCSASLPPHQSD